MQNVALERAGIDAQVDHRSHERRGIEQEPPRTWDRARRR
jgi:hypothetical protein